jgi:alanine racemase
VIDQPATVEARLAAVGLPPLPRTAWLEIDLAALASNVATARTLLTPGVRLAAVVKADAYGHGLVPTARAFAGAGADYLCVATLDEALAVAGARTGVPVLVLFQPPLEGMAAAAAAGVEVTVSAEGTAEAMARLRLPGGTPLRVHLEVDTGLRRAGVPVARVAAGAAALLRTAGVELAGVWTHLASAHDATVTAAQVDRFHEACAAVEATGARHVLRHVSATGGVFAATAPQFDMVRLGLSLYGLLPEAFPVAPDARDAAAALRPAMSLRARPLRVTDVSPGEGVGYGARWRAERPSRIATLPVGYGDGWVYASAGRTEALVRGRRVPLVGSVAMDAIAADVTDVPGVGTGDEFVLLGAQGSEQIGALELARARTTIPWEIVTAMASRLPRVYDAGGVVMSVRTLSGEVRPAGAGAA